MRQMVSLLRPAEFPHVRPFPARRKKKYFPRSFRGSIFFPPAAAVSKRESQVQGQERKTLIFLAKNLWVEHLWREEKVVIL